MLERHGREQSQGCRSWSPHPQPGRPSKSKMRTISSTLASPLIWTAAILLCALPVGCHSRQPEVRTSIEFTKVPPAAQGGRERVDTISGRVTGARPGQKIVIYARSGPWWVQPWPDQALIPIQADSTWSTSPHLGFEYAAMLVDPEYHPAPTVDIAPAAGGAVVAVELVKGVGPI